MRIQLLAIIVLIGCQTGPEDLPGGPDATLAAEATASVTTDRLKAIFDEVDGARSRLAAGPRSTLFGAATP